MSEELTLHEAALRLYDYGPRIEMASTEEELIRLCDERDKLLSFFREADASRASPTPPTTEGRKVLMKSGNRCERKRASLNNPHGE